MLMSATGGLPPTLEPAVGLFFLDKPLIAEYNLFQNRKGGVGTDSFLIDRDKEVYGWFTILVTCVASIFILERTHDTW